MICLLVWSWLCSFKTRKEHSQLLLTRNILCLPYCTAEYLLYTFFSLLAILKQWDIWINKGFACICWNEFIMKNISQHVWATLYTLPPVIPIWMLLGEKKIASCLAVLLLNGYFSSQRWYSFSCSESFKCSIFICRGVLGIQVFSDMNYFLDKASFSSSSTREENCCSDGDRTQNQISQTWLALWPCGCIVYHPGCVLILWFWC